MLVASFDEQIGVRPDDADGVGYARRLLHAGVLLEDFEGGNVQGKVLQPHRPPQLGRHVMTRLQDYLLLEPGFLYAEVVFIEIGLQMVRRIAIQRERGPVGNQPPMRMLTSQCTVASQRNTCVLQGACRPEGPTLGRVVACFTLGFLTIRSCHIIRFRLLKAD